MKANSLLKHFPSPPFLYTKVTKDFHLTIIADSHNSVFINLTYFGNSKEEDKKRNLLFLPALFSQSTTSYATKTTTKAQQNPTTPSAVMSTVGISIAFLSESL